MKTNTCLVILLLLSNFLFSQEECATQIIHDYLLENDDAYKLGFSGFTNSTRNFDDTGQVIIIPIVVHVVHLGEAEGFGSNISNGTIVAAINKMNENYQHSNGIDIGIQFCLAKVDPNGMPSIGITRTDGRVVPGYQSEGIGSSSSDEGLDVIEIKELIQWPTDEYYNIHVVHKVQNASAFAYYPQDLPFFRDGTTIDVFYMNNFYSTLSHELGHAFNLLHTFNGDNNGASCPINNDCELDGDLICDTAPHKRDDCFFGNSCVTGSDPTWQNTRLNHMSYCGITNRFTPLQKDRMRAAALTSGSRTILIANESVCTPFPAIDGAITSIDYPEDGSIQPLCGLNIEAEFTFQNMGTTKINQFSVDYTFDNITNSTAFTTNLLFGEAASFTLPPYLIDQNQAVNELTIEITNINESEDENHENDSKSVYFGVYDTCVTANFSELLANSIQIFPNPNHSQFIQISNIPNDLNLNVEIVDVAGRILIQEVYIQNNSQVNIQSLSKGCYYLIFRNESEIFSKPFIKF